MMQVYEEKRNYGKRKLVGLNFGGIVMDNWEYCIVTAQETAEHAQFTIAYDSKVEMPRVNGRLTVLSEMGRNGWELVTVHPLAQGLNEFYFKRQTRR